MIELIKKNKYEKLIIILSVIFIILQSLYSVGGIKPDSLQYFLQAKNFWEYKVNFPLGYSLAIKLVNIATDNIVIASKIIGLLSYILIILFSVKKDFFFTQTVIIFSFYPFITIFSTSLSEPLFYLYNYLLIYYTYQIGKDSFNNSTIVIIPALFFLLIFTRFTGVFVLISFVFYSFYLMKRNKGVDSKLILIIGLSLASFLINLIINKSYSGYYLGKRDHLLVHVTSNFEFLKSITLSFLSDFSFLNVFIHKRLILLSSKLNVFLSIVVSLFLITMVIKKKLFKNHFVVYLIISLIVTLLGCVYSYYTVKIDDTIRIKSNVFLYFVFLFILSINKRWLGTLKLILISILMFNIFTIITYNVNIVSTYKKFNKTISEMPCNEIIVNTKNENSFNKSDSKYLLFKSIGVDQKKEVKESTNPTPNTNCSIDYKQIIQ